jgi:hypothetical protein
MANVLRIECPLGPLSGNKLPTIACAPKTVHSVPAKTLCEPHQRTFACRRPAELAADQASLFQSPDVVLDGLVRDFDTPREIFFDGNGRRSGSRP